MMSRTFKFMIPVLGALLFLLTASAYADRAPDWMVGTFEGYNSKYRQTIIIRMNNNGNLIVTNIKDGEQIARNRADFRRGYLIIDNREYRVEQTGDGFRTIQSDDRQNRVDFRRVGDYNTDWQNDRGHRDDRNGDRNDRNWDRGDQRAPDWMVGTFEGYNRKYRQTIYVRMNNNGDLIVTNLKDGQRIARNRADFRRGYLIIDNREYRIERTNDGFRMTQADDRQNRVDFRRVGDYNTRWQDDRGYGNGRDNRDYRDNRPPDWMVGRFEGYDDQNRRNVFFRMNSDGNLIISNQRDGDRTYRNEASYRRGVLTMDNRDYRLEPTNNGFRMVEVNNRGHYMEFHRTGDY